MEQRSQMLKQMQLSKNEREREVIHWGFLVFFVNENHVHVDNPRSQYYCKMFLPARVVSSRVRTLGSRTSQLFLGANECSFQ